MSIDGLHTYKVFMSFSDIQTPALILDISKVKSNISRMTSHIKSLGVDLRPHLKTSKSIDVARLAVTGNFGGITVSTLREAEYFAERGFVDITLAVCLVPSKLDRAAALTARGVNLKILIDHPTLARALAEHSGDHQVLIEIDCGEHRTGLAWQAPELLEIARLLDGAANVQCAGVLTHAGHSYGCRSAGEMTALAEIERTAVVGAAGRLREIGITSSIVSVGSTPTAVFASDLTGVTEARPGVYMFGDLFQAGIGSCGIDDVALSVLSTVIAHQEKQNILVIDAGGLALSKDRSTQSLAHDCGYGLVCSAHSGKPFPGWTVGAVHQEHGQIISQNPIDFSNHPIGSQVRILPNHVCMTAAAHEQYHVIDGSDPHAPMEMWPRCNGW